MSENQRGRQAEQISAGPPRSAEEESAIYGRDREWFNTYVTPFYAEWMGYGALSASAQRLIPSLRDRAAELSNDDITLLLSMHWRLQVMGAWYAVIAEDPVLAGPVTASLHNCRGGLTAPALCVASIVYAEENTLDALLAYRERKDLIESYNALDEVNAAIAILGGSDEVHPVDPGRVERLGQLLAVAANLQGPPLP